MILCWLNQRFGPLNVTLQRHRASCSACRKSELQLRQLEELLTSESRGLGVEPSSLLQTRIMNSVATTRAPKIAGVSFLLRLALPAACCIAIALFLFKPRPVDQASASRAGTVALAPTRTEAVLPEFPKINLKVVDPLTKEMQSLLADSRNAARSLAANFLPDRFEAQ
jgi:hypothetical protein